MVRPCCARRTPSQRPARISFCFRAGATPLGEEFDHGLIAGTQAALEIGDNITTQDNSEIRAEEGNVVRGDHGNADTGTGTVMDLRGRFIAPLITFYGNADDDRFTFNQTYLGGETFAYGSNAASMGYDPGNAPQGDAGSDQFVVNHLQTMPGGPGDTAPPETARPTLNLDGQNGSDTYLIRQMAVPVLRAITSLTSSTLALPTMK